MLRRRARPLVLLALLAGCRGEPAVEPASGSPSVAPPEGPSAPAPAPAPPPSDPGAVDPAAPDPLLDALGEEPTPGEEDQPVALPSAPSDRAAPARGCVLVSDAPIRAMTSAGPPAIIAEREGFLVAAYDARGLAIVRVRPGALPEPFASVEFPSTRTSAPALARTGEHEVSFVATDAAGRVILASADPTLPAVRPVPIELSSSGADGRFAPALRAVGERRVVAWTDGSATPMRVRVAVEELGRVASTHDVTPVAGGGAAPAFLEGGEPQLYFLDPRVGISVAHRVPIGADGTPGPTEVSRPLNLAAEPPAFAIARAGGRTWLAYAAVGNLATRAVGLVAAVGDERPAPLVPGLGYGDPLALDGEPHGSAVVFALEAPTAASPSAPHEVRVRRVDAEGPGEPLVVPGPATDPAIARGDGGLLGLAYRAGESVVVALVRCAE